MKRFSLILLALGLAAFTSCKDKPAAGQVESPTAAQPAVNAPAPTQDVVKPEYMTAAEGAARTTVEWFAEEYNYGTVKEGTVVEYQFKFKNTGSNPLTLTSVKASCGCTTPSWSKEPIAPGKEGFINVSFNTKNREGVQSKTVTVTGNFDNEVNKVLRIDGVVEKG